MRQEQAIETRAKLLSAAQKLFAEKGYNETPVRLINKSIGMADGLLYHYFPGGKKEILQVLLHEKFKQVLDDLTSRNGNLDHLPIEQMLEHLFQSAAEVFESHQEVLKILIRESEVIELVEFRQLVVTVRNGRSRLPSILKQRAEAGEICEMDYESAAEVVMAVLMNHLLVKLTGIGSGQLSDPEKRRLLIQYQVDLWKNTQR